MKKFLDSISYLDSILSIMGVLNTFLGSILFVNSRSLLVVLLLLSGFSLLLYISYRAKIQGRIANYIIATAKERRLKEPFLFINLEKDKQQIFLELSEKFPQMTCISLKKRIDSHFKEMSLPE